MTDGPGPGPSPGPGPGPSDASPAQELDDPHARTWTPGARVPHFPLADGTGSTLDTAAPGFALLTDDASDHWQQAAGQARNALGVTVTVHQLSPGTITGAALIRPDGVIAWKPPAGTPTAEAAPQLTPILAALLSTRPGGHQPSSSRRSSSMPK
jgi:putative polyketide hydroxylase